ncbi:MAG: oxidoreductase-like domain-containing protein [Polaromonas sp.]|nr:oxidoreductase-like domain-containing protein [Polaromonas sp.]
MFSALSLRAGELGKVLREPPPEPDSCCGRGCNGCVWESYYAAAAWWQEDALRAIAAQAPPA